jgi:hypothetical protein
MEFLFAYFFIVLLIFFLSTHNMHIMNQLMYEIKEGIEQGVEQDIEQGVE